MSAREILATTYIEGHNRPIGHLHAKAIEVALTAAGFSIVHKDEIHAPSVDADDIATALWREDAMGGGTPASVAKGRTRQAFDDQSDELQARWRRFARAALRELMKEVG